MYECGDGRVSELLSRWLLKLGLTAKSFVQEMEEVRVRFISQKVSPHCAGGGGGPPARQEAGGGGQGELPQQLQRPRHHHPPLLGPGDNTPLSLVHTTPILASDWSKQVNKYFPPIGQQNFNASSA